MTTQIAVYREAARLIQDARLATLTDDIPSRYSFDDAWDHVVEFVLRSGYWKFALKTLTPDISTVPPLPGFSFAYDLPCDWLRNHALFTLPSVAPMASGAALECPFDARHQLEQIHCNIGVENLNEPGPIYLRYISSDYADPDTWSENFAHAVAARLAFDCAKRITGNPEEMEQLEQKWQTAYQMAVAPDALVENDWLRFQFNGTFYRGLRWLLDEAEWRFCMKTIELVGNTIDSVPVSPNYTYAAAKPSDYGRVFQYYFSFGGSDTLDIDFRDEGGLLHSQYQNTVLRYVSTDGERSANWPDGFRRALMSYLQLEEAKTDPKAAGAQLQARGLAWAEAFKNAKLKNDMGERPKYNDIGRLVRARRRGFGYDRLSRQAGGWW